VAVQQIRHPWSLALLGSVALVVVIAVVSSSLAAISVPRRHAQAATATPAAPTPTLTPGYAYYTEAASGFQVQYPQSWQVITKNPGVEFDDNALDPTYVVQVLVPSTMLASQADWVEYELKNISQTAGVSAVQRIGGDTQVVVGGVPWTSAVAQVQQSNVTIAVRVLATMYHDRAYIINLLAENMQPGAATPNEFAAMLASFSFVT
jgi:hypothetical protein